MDLKILNRETGEGPGSPPGWLLRGLLITACLFVLVLILDYRMNWQSWDYPFVYFPQIVRNGPRFLPEDISRIFNIGEEGFLQNPVRVRYFQNLVLLLDAKARIWLFRYLPPHPSVSLTWITTLLAPVFFYKFLRIWSDNARAAKIGVILFMFSSGFLSHLNLICNPGKALSTALAAVCLYLAAKTRVLLSAHGRITRRVLINYLLLLIFLCVAFFTDEIAWILIAAVPLLVPGLFAVRGTKSLSAGLYLGVLFLIGVSVIYVAPELIRRATPGNPRVDIFALNLAPGEDAAPITRFWEWFNCPYLLRSIRNLLSSQLVLIGHPWTLLAYFFVAPYFLAEYLRMDSVRQGLVARGLAAVFLFIAYQSFGFASVFHEEGFVILNPFYYGSQLSVFLPIPIAVFLSSGTRPINRLINSCVLLLMVVVMAHNYFSVSWEIRKMTAGFTSFGDLDRAVALEAYRKRKDPAAIDEMRSRYSPRSPWDYIREIEFSARENARNCRDGE